MKKSPSLATVKRQALYRLIAAKNKTEQQREKEIAELKQLLASERDRCNDLVDLMTNLIKLLSQK